MTRPITLLINSFLDLFQWGLGPLHHEEDGALIKRLQVSRSTHPLSRDVYVGAVFRDELPSQGPGVQRSGISFQGASF